MDVCGECGFEYHLNDAMSAGAGVVNGAVAIADLVGDDTSDVRARRLAQTWSPLEYACHVRDVLLVQRERVLTARRQNLPSFDPMGRDERVEHDGYAEQDPEGVARQPIDAAHLFANVLSRPGLEDQSAIGTDT